MLPKIASLWMLAAEAAPTTQPTTGRSGGGLLDMLPLLIIIFVIMYIFIFGPQRKKEKQRRRMLEAVTKGDEVVTIGGIHGKVWQIKDDELVVSVSDDTKLTFTRGAIARVQKKGEGAPKE